MSRRSVRLTSAAERDLVEATAWYRREAPHVVSRFRSAVREALQRLAENPLIHAVVYRDVRFAIVHGFLFSILFRVQDNQVQVIAIFHQSRNPQAWQSRF